MNITKPLNIFCDAGHCCEVLFLPCFWAFWHMLHHDTMHWTLTWWWHTLGVGEHILMKNYRTPVASFQKGDQLKTWFEFQKLQLVEVLRNLSGWCSYSCSLHFTSRQKRIHNFGKPSLWRCFFSYTLLCTLILCDTSEQSQYSQLWFQHGWWTSARRCIDVGKDRGTIDLVLFAVIRIIIVRTNKTIITVIIVIDLPSTISIMQC